MKTLIPIAAILLLVVFYACNTKKIDEQNTNYEVSCISLESPEKYKEQEPVLMDAKVEYSCSPSPEKSDFIDVTKVDKKKIIKDGMLSIKVLDVEKGKKSIDAILKKLNSYYENESLENNESHSSYNLKIRIPSANFDEFLRLLENGTGEVLSKDINARDVTEEYVDIETRLKNKKMYLQRYNELLSKTGTIKDILALEENIRNLQEEIESKEGRLKFLNDQVAYSTLNVELLKEKEYVYNQKKVDSFYERLKASLSSGWSNTINFILLLIGNWTVLIAIVTFVFLIRRFWRNRKK
ncbi:MAG: DUF4349 domain-containing protein [Bacteroidota bacterium]